MILWDREKGTVRIVRNNEVKPKNLKDAPLGKIRPFLVTTIRCADDNCCGCLNADFDPTPPQDGGKGCLIFYCNECGGEGGRADAQEELRRRFE